MAGSALQPLLLLLRLFSSLPLLSLPLFYWQEGVVMGQPDRVGWVLRA